MGTVALRPTIFSIWKVSRNVNKNGGKSQPLETVTFNTQRFALEISHNQYALFDRATYMIYNISAAFFNFLSLFYSNPRPRDFALTHPSMNTKLWTKLLDMGVLQGRL